MIGRYVFSIAVGCFITLTLIFVMHLLIEHAEDAMSSEGTRHMLDFVRIKRNETLNTEDLTPEKPEKPPDVPPEVPPQDMDNVDPNAPTIKIPAPVVTANVVHILRWYLWCSALWRFPDREMCAQWLQASRRRLCRRWREWWGHSPECF